MIENKLSHRRCSFFHNWPVGLKWTPAWNTCEAWKHCLIPMRHQHNKPTKTCSQDEITKALTHCLISQNNINVMFNINHLTIWIDHSDLWIINDCYDHQNDPFGVSIHSVDNDRKGKIYQLSTCHRTLLPVTLFYTLLQINTGETFFTSPTLPWLPVSVNHPLKIQFLSILVACNKSYTTDLLAWDDDNQMGSLHDKNWENRTKISWLFYSYKTRFGYQRF